MSRYHLHELIKENIHRWPTDLEYIKVGHNRHQWMVGFKQGVEIDAFEIQRIFEALGTCSAIYAKGCKCTKADFDRLKEQEE